jgi:hypothetical protein
LPARCIGGSVVPGARHDNGIQPTDAVAPATRLRPGLRNRSARLPKESGADDLHSLVQRFAIALTYLRAPRPGGRRPGRDGRGYSLPGVRPWLPAPELVSEMSKLQRTGLMTRATDLISSHLLTGVAIYCRAFGPLHFVRGSEGRMKGRQKSRPGR